MITLAATVWLFAAASVCLAQASTSDTSEQLKKSSRLIRISVLPETRTNSGSHDFGTVSPLDHPEIFYDFVLRNDSPRPLVLTRLLPSCSCTSVTVTVAGATAYSREGAENVQTLPAVAPGQQFTVLVSINLVHLAPGPTLKSVAVFVRGKRLPAFTLEMKGTLLPVASFAPAFIDFGKLDPRMSAATSSQRLTVSLDARLAPKGQWPALVSSNPDVRLTPLPAAVPIPSPDAHQGTLKGMVPRRYQLTLTPGGTLGPLQGRVSFVAPAKTGSTASSGAASDPGTTDGSSQAFLAEPSALLIGEIAGDVSASPASLAFGAVPAGQLAIRTILLTAGSAALLSGLKASCASPWLTPRLSGETHVFSGGQSAVRSLAVSLRPGMPDGVVRSDVVVTLRTGQRLVIPASAYTAPR